MPCNKNEYRGMKLRTRYLILEGARYHTLIRICDIHAAIIKPKTRFKNKCINSFLNVQTSKGYKYCEVGRV
jgi:hypothetical protein